jgi:hypothetical protein
LTVEGKLEGIAVGGNIAVVEVADHPNLLDQQNMVIVQESLDMDLVSYDVEGIASIGVGQRVMGHIAASKEMLLASAGWDCNQVVHSSLYRPSYQT